MVLLSCLSAARVGAEPVGPSARMPLIVGSAWRAAAIVCWAPVGSLRSTWMTVDLPARPVGEALAAGVEAGVADFLVDADGVGDAGGLHAARRPSRRRSSHPGRRGSGCRALA